MLLLALRAAVLFTDVAYRAVLHIAIQPGFYLYAGGYDRKGAGSLRNICIVVDPGTVVDIV